MGLFGKSSRELSLESEVDSYSNQCLKLEGKLNALSLESRTASEEVLKLNDLLALQNHKLAIYSLHNESDTLLKEAQIIMNCGFFMNGAIEGCSLDVCSHDELTEEDRHAIYYFCERMKHPIEEFSEGLAKIAYKIISMKDKVSRFNIHPTELVDYYDEIESFSNELGTQHHLNEFTDGIKNFFMFSWSSIQSFENSYAQIGFDYSIEKFDSCAFKLNYSDELIERFGSL